MNTKKNFSRIIISLFVWMLLLPPALQAQQKSQVPAVQSDPETGWWQSLPKEEKRNYTVITSAALVGLWGLATWDYGSSGMHLSSEGWFEQDSKHGGADKLGHFWFTYSFADALSALYESYGYDAETAHRYGALSSWTVQMAMEVGDASSESQGFSWEDSVVNTVGALTSILMYNYPEINRKIDFRMEYVFNVKIEGIFDDYSNHFYSLALKLNGFDSLEDTFLKYFELHAGYYTRGYENTDNDKRAIYGGISLNFSRLFSQYGYHKTGKVLEYFQVLYSTLKVTHEL
jgi:hypothetical protein